MYCTQCGKWIDDESGLCPECRSKAVNAGPETVKQDVPDSAQPESVSEQPMPGYDYRPYEQPYGYAPEPIPDDGKGVAVRSFVFGIISFVLSYILIFTNSAALGFFVASGGAHAATAGTPVLYVLLLANVAMEILSIIWGIKAIKTFKKVKNLCPKKPVKTLVFGIIGLSLSGVAVILTFIGFILLLVAGFAGEISSGFSL